MRHLVLLVAAFAGLLALEIDFLLRSDSVPALPPERTAAPSPSVPMPSPSVPMPPPSAVTPEPRSIATSDDEEAEAEAEAMDFDGYPGQVPSRSRGVGDSTLHLTLLDRVTRAAFPANVRLWRLGVPGDAEWTAGDHIQAVGHVPAEGLTFRRLPEGRYRIESNDLRNGSEDPPDFHVGPGDNRRAAEADPPRDFRVRVILQDERGEPVLRALKDHRGGGSKSSSMLDAPDWARPRRPRDGREFVQALSMGMG